MNERPQKIAHGSIIFGRIIVNLMFGFAAACCVFGIWDPINPEAKSFSLFIFYGIVFTGLISFFRWPVRNQ